MTNNELTEMAKEAKAEFKMYPIDYVGDMEISFTLNQLTKFAQLIQDKSVPEDVLKDAERYRYWKDKLISVDFDYQDSGQCVVILESPTNIGYVPSFDMITDRAMLAASQELKGEVL